MYVHGERRIKYVRVLLTIVDGATEVKIGMYIIDLSVDGKASFQCV